MPPKNTPKKTLSTSKEVITKVVTQNEFLDEAKSLGYLGHETILSQVYNQLQYKAYGLHTQEQPFGINLLVGPSGVGKTSLVETVAQILHRSRSNMLKIDCAEYGSGHEVAKLVGSPPGYLGHKDTKPLLSKVNLDAIASQHCSIPILLFDEIEKGHVNLFNLLLGILDRGTLSTGDNIPVKFSHCLIFMTSNLGIKKASQFGLLADKPTVKESNVLNAVKKFFSPEFIGRIGPSNIHFFKPLSLEELNTIIKNQVSTISSCLMQSVNAYIYKMTKDVAAFILEKADCNEYGGRDISKVIRNYVIPQIVKYLIDNNISPANKFNTKTGISMSMRHGEVMIELANAA